MGKIRFLIAAVAALSVVQVDSLACTSVIVSGRVTPDGRPLMWKNRDTGAKGNYVRFFPALNGNYSFVAVVNEGDEELKDVWIGTNSEGFSIMNTHSYNITDADTKDVEDMNGSFMRMALENCASVKEFEEMINRTPKPWQVSANFGVIDGRGGAAYFEMNWTEYFKYDANDPAVAPDGYLVRTNFSYNGRPMNEGMGHVRYLEADRKMKEALAAGDFTPHFFLENLVRDYTNPLTGIDYRSPEYIGEWAVEQDIIVRYKTTSSVIIQGTKPGEDPALSTMWTVIGYPGTTVCLPVWGSCGQEGIPVLLGENLHSELFHWGKMLKERLFCFDMDSVSGQKYFKRTLLSNQEGTGYLQTILKAEPELLRPYEKSLEKWRAEGNVNQDELTGLNRTACRQVRELYSPMLTSTVSAGKVSMTINASGGARIMSFCYDGKDVLSKMRFPNSYGSTFWTSPQTEWNWPPVAEFDRLSYSVEETDSSLVMTGMVSREMGFRIIKEFTTDDEAVIVKYTIVNESGEEKKVAPWEITRVPGEGLIFFDAPLESIIPPMTTTFTDKMPFFSKYGISWFEVDNIDKPRKVNADGHGWLAYLNDGLLLVKEFEDIQASEAAPAEAEVQIYVNAGLTYIELENQGRYVTLKPGEKTTYRVRWHLIPFPGDAAPSKGLIKTVRFK